MNEKRPLTVVCLSTYEKGQELIRECKRQGCHVILLTLETLREADWPREYIDETFYMPGDFGVEDIIKSLGFLARTRPLDRIVPLDDFDVETAASLREHFRLPGMGDTTARYFRDKLAMRMKARDHNILVPEFVHVLNQEALRDFMRRVPPPWMLKPRAEASAIGISKVRCEEELWPLVEDLGDRQSYYLLERFVPGEIFHVDSIVWGREVVFEAAHKYGAPPIDVAHEGGVFLTRTAVRASADAQALAALNRDLLESLGLARGVTHTEFIKAHEDGRFYFLETAARVGGANIAEVIEAATGINLWAEWAKIEVAGEHGRYEIPTAREDYAGIVTTLARQEWPDTSAYDDPEIVWRLRKRHHVGLIVASHDPQRVEWLLHQYSRRFLEDFFARMPAPDKATS